MQYAWEYSDLKQKYLRLKSTSIKSNILALRKAIGPRGPRQTALISPRSAEKGTTSYKHVDLQCFQDFVQSTFDSFNLEVGKYTVSLLSVPTIAIMADEAKAQTELKDFNNLFSLDGKVVVVTGGSRGLGLHAASGYPFPLPLPSHLPHPLSITPH